MKTPSPETQDAALKRRSISSVSVGDEVQVSLDVGTVAANLDEEDLDWVHKSTVVFGEGERDCAKRRFRDFQDIAVSKCARFPAPFLKRSSWLQG